MPLSDADTAENGPLDENVEEIPIPQDEAELASVAEDTSFYTVSDGTERVEDKPPEEMSFETE